MLCQRGMKHNKEPDDASLKTQIPTELVGDKQRASCNSRFGRMLLGKECEWRGLLIEGNKVASLSVGILIRQKHRFMAQDSQRVF
jgi:hypothetical protein